MSRAPHFFGTFSVRSKAFGIILGLRSLFFTKFHMLGEVEEG